MGLVGDGLHDETLSSPHQDKVPFPQLSLDEAAQPGELDSSPNALPLEAILPPTLYSEFQVAVQEAETARDEIPLEILTPGATHNPQLEGDPQENDPEPDLISESETAFEHQASEAEDASAESSANTDEKPWDNGSSEGEGGVSSVPDMAASVPVEVVGSEDALEELPQRHKRRWRHYKIQEVIKRNQIVLIQVVKEERGTKGAALTTYLSLAGRYTVLMPNTPSGGGISRKITVPADRKRLKEIAQELEVPEGMGLIIRTAGASRTKAEIKRDFEYLLRLWENVRDLTLKSTAPCLVYEEGDLIKRSIRDLYNKDIDEILVAGDDAYRDAKEFMRMLMPSHAKNVQVYKDPEPLFTKFEVERQLNQMFSPVVTLKSGGYIVLNQTEALVAIDVNSGRATREYSIEDTAFKTNLEASEEVARQVRLRDLAGLIVIDFIDMDERRNNRAVERRLKECLRHDRARIQVGHISHFGLLEMSRQRLRQGVVEVSTMPCPVCQGVGHIRSTESVGLMILRSIEDHLRTQGPANITASASGEAALYILNHKRSYLQDIEARYSVTIHVQVDEKAHGAHYTLQRAAEATRPAGLELRAVQPISIPAEPFEEDEDDSAADGSEEARASRRKRRRRRGRGDSASSQAEGLSNGGADEIGEADLDDAERLGGLEEPVDGAVILNGSSGPTDDEASPAAEEDREGAFRRGRRRGRRGGRRLRSDFPQPNGEVPGLGEQPVVDFSSSAEDALSLRAEQADPAARSTPSAAAISEVRANPAPVAVLIEKPAVKAEELPVEDTLARLQQNGTAVDSEASFTPASESGQKTPAPKAIKPSPVRTGPPRKGWWQRRLG